MPSTMAAGATNPTSTLPVLLHTSTRHPHIYLERAFAAVFFCAILALLRHHAVNLLSSTGTNHVSFHLSLLLLVADTVLAFQWVTAQTFRLWGIRRHQFLENLEKVMEERDFPAVDVVICTADPYKEPPIVAVNTALSVMAYDYPPNKVSVYLSDDGGSELTLFAFMEAAKFAGYWLPFCRTNRILETSPEAYFASNYVSTSETRKIKEMYENMRIKIENVLGKGKVDEEYLGSVDQRQAINKWSHDFTGQDHPTLIQVLLVAGQDKDLSGHSMPNLVYVTREKRRTHPHHFKAGALNTMTTATLQQRIAAAREINVRVEETERKNLQLEKDAKKWERDFRRIEKELGKMTEERDKMQSERDALQEELRRMTGNADKWRNEVTSRDQRIKELDAMIADLQRAGNDVVEKWKASKEGEEYVDLIVRPSIATGYRIALAQHAELFENAGLSEKQRWKLIGFEDIGFTAEGEAYYLEDGPSAPAPADGEDAVADPTHIGDQG
ncbi:hypothetical protein Dimus_037179 [Dionaea muscipula]